jgi:hypothetical protein
VILAAILAYPELTERAVSADLSRDYHPLMGGELEEVRRAADDELEGFVRQAAGGFHGLTVFHGMIATASTADEARAIVHARGISSLAERWFWWSRGSGAWSVVLPQEASAGKVRVAVGYYALPGVEMATITADDLDAGDVLTLVRPDAPVDGFPE